MRKEMEENSYSPSALSTQLILLGGQISAVPGEGKQKMSQINQEQNDWWPVSAAHSTRLLIIQLQMKAGAEDDFHPRRRSHLGRLLLIAPRNGTRCFQPWGIFTRSLRNNQWGILPMQARSSSAGTLIGWGAPVCCFWLSFSAASCGGPRSPTGPNTAAAFQNARIWFGRCCEGKEMGNVPFLNSAEVKRAGCAESLIWFHVCFPPGWCVFRLLQRSG